MTDQQFNKLLAVINEGFGKLRTAIYRVEEAVQKQKVESQQPTVKKAPNYSRRLAEFLNFDWSSIQATVEESDDDGPTIVRWEERLFKRRTGNQTFGDNAIYFSRSVGKDGEKNLYEWLISFKDIGGAKELSRKLLKTVQAGAKNGDPGKSGNGNGKTGAQPQRQFSCQSGLVMALTKKNDACTILGITPEKWKAALKTSELSSDDVRAFSDDQMRRALEIIEDLIVAEQERRAVAEEGQDFSPNF